MEIQLAFRRSRHQRRNNKSARCCCQTCRENKGECAVVCHEAQEASRKPKGGGHATNDQRSQGDYANDATVDQHHRHNLMQGTRHCSLEAIGGGGAMEVARNPEAVTPSIFAPICNKQMKYLLCGCKSNSKVSGNMHVERNAGIDVGYVRMTRPRTRVEF